MMSVSGEGSVRVSILRLINRVSSDIKEEYLMAIDIDTCDESILTIDRTRQESSHRTTKSMSREVRLIHII